MKYTINMKLPSLNDYTKWCRGNKFLANKRKQELEYFIALYLKEMPRWDKPIKIHFHWIEGNKKRDLDNICFSKKFILDSMVKYGKLKDDNRNCVCAFTDTFEYGNSTKVILEIDEIEEN